MSVRTVLNAALSATVRAPLLGIALIASTGCHATRRGGGVGSMTPSSPPAVAAVVAPAPDERVVQGLVEVTGTALEMQEVLHTESGVLRLFPSRIDSIALMRLENVMVAARGVDAPGGLRVSSFTVVSVRGVPVIDGFVRADGDGLLLETAQGKVPIGNPPDVFRILIGARVWIQGALATGPYQYGVIRP